jgi:hypothetical protein
MKGLTPGRIVHYVFGQDHRAAIVVTVQDQEAGVVNLSVFIDAKDFPPENEPPRNLWRPGIPYSEEPKVGTWHWIEPA